MSKPYGILSDLHFHGWNAFAKTLPNGLNSRLQAILDDVRRAATELKAVGGDTLYLAGDIFHVRGQVEPSVLNPVLEVFAELHKFQGIKVRAIPGNHDLASKESEALNNAAHALVAVGVEMVSDPMGELFNKLGEEQPVCVVPWHASPKALLGRLDGLARTYGTAASRIDLIIHAPVNGVIMGIPDHGLEPSQLAALGFKRVFAGHYHNHVDFGNGVYSIGATTHQTWGDVGTKAGFLIVHPDRVEWRASHAPSFVDITETTDPTQVPMIVDGNYVRVKLEIEKDSEVEACRQSLAEMGALGVVVHPVKKAATVTRSGASATAVSSLVGAVGDYIKTTYAGNEDLSRLCEEILNQTVEVSA